MNAYLDWSRAEDDRVEAWVAQEMKDGPIDTGRRGIGEILSRIDRQIAEEEPFYLAEA